MRACEIVLGMFYSTNSLEVLMDIEKQREIIRLWNRMRRVEGPIAEEIRIQILEYFAQQDRAKRAA